MNPPEFLFKILIIGDPGCGKSSLTKRFVHGKFSDQAIPTIGVDFLLKIITLPDPEAVIRLQLWDVAGQERFGNLTKQYYRDAVAAILLMDITRPETLNGAAKWKHDLDDKLEVDGESVPVLLVCNKIDILNGKKEYIDSMAEKLNKWVVDEKASGFLMTSAKTNENVDSAFSFIIDQIMSKKSNLIAGEQGNIGLRLGKEEKREEIETCTC